MLLHWPWHVVSGMVRGLNAASLALHGVSGMVRGLNAASLALVWRLWDG